ncbi:UNVERIFIED_CONTAM: hypothetical protein HDU68_000015 [Siphonaria sp. JEL0065]|nr:hypothetical protein HDU68_000015 [Siphonaria sp. JEL0065]
MAAELQSGTITTFGSSWVAFYPTPGTACGTNYPPANDALFAALSFKFLSDPSSILNSNLCGKCVKLWKEEQSVVVTIVDAMLRGNASRGDVDLSTSAFSVFAKTDVGVVPDVNWQFIDCASGETIPSPIASAQTTGSIPTATATTEESVVASATKPAPNTELFDSSASSNTAFLPLLLAFLL